MQQVNSETTKKLVKFSDKQQTTDRILKAMQKDMKIFYCKLKHSLTQVCIFYVIYSFIYSYIYIFVYLYTFTPFTPIRS